MEQLCGWVSSFVRSVSNTQKRSRRDKSGFRRSREPWVFKCPGVAVGDPAGLWSHRWCDRVFTRDAGIPPFGVCYPQPRAEVSEGEVSRKMPGLPVCPLYLPARTSKPGRAASRSGLSHSVRSGHGVAVSLLVPWCGQLCVGSTEVWWPTT